MLRELSAEPSNKRKSHSQNAPKSKKSKTQEDNDEHDVDKDPDTQQRPRARIIVARRSPLPARTNRNLHPGEPDMPKPRRSSEEVSIANVRKEDLKAQLAKANQDRVTRLAKMAEQDDIEAATEDAAAVRSLQEIGRAHV